MHYPTAWDRRFNRATRVAFSYVDQVHRGASTQPASHIAQTGKRNLL
jgi:hypothetical protein